MNELELIQRAKERISRGWTRKAHARNSRGTVVTSDSPEASRWCIMGALGVDVLSTAEDPEAVVPVLRKLHVVSGFDILTIWNDAPDTTSGQILAVLEKVEQEILAEKSHERT
jgi:hypothetical protein